ncbi:MAG: arginine--tRNA ligase [Coriobacteriales bacterium]|jgi:arginyl-tRNA synthetase|nr:arginine--tRNA ligase [Coriobacteriales bacterium]
MRQVIVNILQEALSAAVCSGELALSYTPESALERPRDEAHGDWASSIALRLAKELRLSPRAVATIIVSHIAPSTKDELFEAVEVAGAGFINFKLAPVALHRLLRAAFEQDKDFARLQLGVGQAVNVEFVSANPTGPLHVGHGRWAALGNAICNILEHCGWRVTREFYINDAGRQMELFAESVAARYLTLCGRPTNPPPDGYAGTYIEDLAGDLYAQEGTRWLDITAAQRNREIGEEAYARTLANIQAVCAQLGVRFDVWFSERSLYAPEARTGLSAIEMMLQKLAQDNYLYQKDGATWFRSTDFFDDKDRVMVKSSGEYTYFAPDSAYHLSKFMRLTAPPENGDGSAVSAVSDGSAGSAVSAVSDGSDGLSSTSPPLPNTILTKNDEPASALPPSNELIAPPFPSSDTIPEERGGATAPASPDVPFDYLVDIWGADHHGYIPRMQAACAALGFEGRLTVVLGQLVNLFRNGKPVRMSKRSGELVTLEELVDEVGADATKYLMLARSADQPLDFDIEVAKRHDTSNPVYYVQYAHARICSLRKKAADRGLDVALLPSAQLALLVHESELALIRHLGRLGDTLERCARDLAPQRLVRYNEELAASFHRFYTECVVLDPANQELSLARLYLSETVRQVLALSLSLLGVRAPERM